ncbi:MAG: PTS sugar transporter subunit IIA [Spirochaetaceae bacterium]|nr:MAG: PTS sugar transporter subunit IIA [Spirochaetaceae bacterium]
MLKEVLTQELVSVGLSARTKEDVINALLDMLCTTGKVKDRATALQDILANEERMSTGLEQGIAIPHAKTEAVEEMVACVAVTEHRIDFESVDHKPAHIFIMTLSPKGQTGPHMKFLAEVSRLLKDKKMRRNVVEAGDSAELYALLTD